MGRRRHKDEEEQRETPTTSGTTNSPSVDEIQRLQQTAGNAAVSAMIARQDFQLQTPSLGSGAGFQPRRPSLGVGQLHLDPEIQAQAQAYIRQNLATNNVLDAIRNIPPSVVNAAPAAANPLQQPAQPGQQQQRAPDPAPPPGQEKQPEPGSVGTLLSAITEVPEVQHAIADLQRQTWDRLSGAQQIGVVSVAIGLGAGIPQSREFLINQLSGVPIPVPPLPGLSIEFTGKDGNRGLGLHLDVGRFLPSSLGFGPAGAGDPAQPLFGDR